MGRLLLDTTFIIDVLNDRRGWADLMERFILEQHTPAYCAINVAEVYVGLRAPKAQKTEALLRQLTYIPIRWEAARLAGGFEKRVVSERPDTFFDGHNYCGCVHN